MDKQKNKRKKKKRVIKSTGKKYITKLKKMNF